jgi:hypothetical protein
MQTSIQLNALQRFEASFKTSQSLFFLLFILAFTACKKNDHDFNNGKCVVFKELDKYDKTTPTVSVFATGFNNPRGLKFGPDCNLYVAEAGLGGTFNSSEVCPDIQPPAAAGAPFLGSPTGGRISKVNAMGVRSTVTDKLPTTVSQQGDILGVADVAFIDDKLYALLWAGCSHGVPDVPNGIVRVNWDGTHTVIANIGAWQLEHKVKNPGEDFEPEGNPFTMIVVDNKFYVVEANQGQLLKATLDGKVSRVIDISAKEGHIVPTVADFYHGNFYLGNLGPFPTVEGSSKIYKISEEGKIEVFAEGFTTILGLVFDKKGRIYVLENTTGNPFPTPGTGRVVRLNHNGTRDVVAEGLSLPTAMTYGPDDNLYVSNWGFGKGEGGGEIIKIRLKDMKDGNW